MSTLDIRGLEVSVVTEKGQIEIIAEVFTIAAVGQYHQNLARLAILDPGGLWSGLGGGWQASECPGPLQHGTHVAVEELARGRAVVSPTVANHGANFTAEVIAAGHELPSVGGGERFNQTFLR